MALAEAEATRLEGASDPEQWAAATHVLAEIPDPYGVAYARMRRAEAELRRTGVRADVAGLLSGAAAAARELGARPLLAELEQLARRARVDLGARAAVPTDAQPVTAPVTHRLSAREVEVLRLVADGRSNGEIADALFIARKTAGVHVTHILDKLGVTNRVEAAMAAARLGLLEDDGARRS